MDFKSEDKVSVQDYCLPPKFLWASVSSQVIWGGKWLFSILPKGAMRSNKAMKVTINWEVLFQWKLLILTCCPHYATLLGELVWPCRNVISVKWHFLLSFWFKLASPCTLTHLPPSPWHGHSLNHEAPRTVRFQSASDNLRNKASGLLTPETVSFLLQKTSRPQLCVSSRPRKVVTPDEVTPWLTSGTDVHWSATLVRANQ